MWPVLIILFCLGALYYKFRYLPKRKQIDELFNSSLAYLEKVEGLVRRFDATITEVVELEYVKSLNYTENNNQIIDSILTRNALDELDTAVFDMGEIPEYLQVLQFTDQYGSHCYVTVYDKDETWGEPAILKIYKP